LKQSLKPVIIITLMELQTYLKVLLCLILN